MTTLTSSHFGSSAKRDIGSAWGWLIALGALMIVLGAVAFSNLPVATAASVYTVGILMLIGAGVQLAAGIFSGSWGRFALALLSAALYGVAGALTLANPLLAAAVLTLLLGSALVVSGAVRIGWSFALRPMPGWGWVAFSGAITALAGLVFISGWPADTVYLLGAVLAVDLTFQGVSAIGWGITLRNISA